MKKKMSIAQIEHIMDRLGAENVALDPDGKLYHKPTREKHEQANPLPSKPRKAVRRLMPKFIPYRQPIIAIDGYKDDTMIESVKGEWYSRAEVDAWIDRYLAGAGGRKEQG